MHSEGCLPFNLLLSLRTGMMVNVVMVDVFGALPAYEGPVGAQGDRERLLLRAADRRTGRPGPHQSLHPKTGPSEGPLLWGGGARRVPNDGGGLAARGLQDTRKVFI